MQSKRILVAILAVILVTLSAMSISATSEAAIETPFTVEATASTAVKVEGTSVTVKGNDIIEISVTAGEKSSEFTVSGIALVLDFDVELLEYVSFTNGSAYSEARENLTQLSRGRFHVGFEGDYAGGKLVTVQFRVKAAAHGKGAVSMHYLHVFDADGNLYETGVAEDSTIITADTHTYGEGEVTAPTCTAGGYTTYICTECGGRFQSEETAATGHTPGAAATCTTNQTCTVCSVELAPAKGHTPGAAATCTTNQTCTVCSVELAPAKGHTPGAAATCTTNQTCTVCNEEVAPAVGHKPGAAATCTTNQRCTVCEVEVAPATGHKPGAEADCTNAQTCTVCGAELAPATGHQLGDWVVDKEATTKEDGSKSQTCSKCGHKVIEKIPMLEKGPFPWWIIVIVVVVLVGGFACYWFFVVKKKED